MSTELQTNQSEGNKTSANDCELIKKINDLESELSQHKQKVSALGNELKAVCEERNNLKAANAKLDKELSEMKKTHSLIDLQVDQMQQQSEKVLTNAKGIIFEKTKVCQNQELQIEALNQQVTSLKEVVSITKDLLEIRNIEVRHLQDKLNNMEQKINLDKEKQALMNKKMDRVLEMNSDLKREYEAQLVLFNALRERYNERELARGVIDESPNENNNENQ